MKKIILAGGCFWGVEAYFLRLKGIVATRVGYTDGEGKTPTYNEVCNSSGHVEAVDIVYDETIISLEKVLNHFFRIIDPTQRNRQGNDFGVQYRSGIYYEDVFDLKVIQDYLVKIASNYNKPIQTTVKLASVFYDGEEYHQRYLEKNPTGYCHVNMQLAKKEELK